MKIKLFLIFFMIINTFLLSSHQIENEFVYENKKQRDRVLVAKNKTRGSLFRTTYKFKLINRIDDKSGLFIPITVYYHSGFNGIGNVKKESSSESNKPIIIINCIIPNSDKYDYYIELRDKEKLFPIGQIVYKSERYIVYSFNEKDNADDIKINNNVIPYKIINCPYCHKSFKISKQKGKIK